MGMYGGTIERSPGGLLTYHLSARPVLLTVLAAGCGADAGSSPDGALPDAPGATDASTNDGGDPPLILVRTWGGLGTGDGQFVEPSSVELDSDGFVYVAGHEDRVQKFTAEGDLVAIWGTSGTGDGQFRHPHGLAVDRARGDIIYVGDQENGRVQAFSRDGAFLRTWTDDQFQHLHDVGIDPATGDIYVGDYELDVLQRFTATGELVFERGGTGTGPGLFNGVWGVSTDAMGNVYAADTFNRRIQKLDADGAFVREWSLGANGATFLKPTGVFVSADQTVYVCDSLAEAVLLYTTEGALIEQWDLRPLIGDRTEPEDIVLDPSGEHVYLVEVAGHRVFHLRRGRAGHTRLERALPDM